jgi:predicted DCC family thiol-disulfide oxidoreductase YuxK
MDDPGISAEHPLILYDGDCPLCLASVRFVLRADREGRIRFSPLGSALGRKIVTQRFPSGKVPDSLIFADQGRVYLRAEAVLAILRYLRWPWNVLMVFNVFPCRLLDIAYRLVAFSRRSFGRRKRSCELPPERYRGRFLL